MVLLNPFYIEKNQTFTVLFLIILILQICERIVSTFFIFSKKKGEEISTYKIFHKRYFYILFASYLTCIFIAFIELVTLKRINVILVVAGYVLYSTGVMLRWLAMSELKEFWSLFVEVKKRQQIVDTGIYRYLKHPYYTAVLFELGGNAFVCNSILAGLFLIFVQIPLIAGRIYVESRVLNVYSRRLKIRPK